LREVVGRPPRETRPLRDETLTPVENEE
jgi:hypothetical protein